MLIWLWGTIGLVAGFTVGVLLMLLVTGRQKMGYIEEARRRAKVIHEEQGSLARREAEEILATASREAEKIKGLVEGELLEKREDLKEIEERIAQREKLAGEKMRNIRRMESEIKKLSSRLEVIKREIGNLRKREVLDLARVSGVPLNEVKGQVLAHFEKELAGEKEKRLMQVEERLREEAEALAEDVLTIASEKIDPVSFEDVSAPVFELPKVRASDVILKNLDVVSEELEKRTGASLMQGEDPNIIMINSQTPEARWVAKRALESMLAWGRFDVRAVGGEIERARHRVEKEMLEVAEKARVSLGLSPIPRKLLMLLGKLYCRYSYGQNLLAHSIEVAKLAGIIATELGVDPELTRRAGFLHDIGKALDDLRGPHAVVGANIARRAGEKEAVAHAIEAHHNDVEPRTPVARIVQVADALSAARPGARRESLEQYLRRLERLEKIASSLPGVQKAYAIQAGREVRVIVVPDVVRDSQLPKIASKIARRMERELSYPGQIKVTVIKETRCTDVAK